MFSFFICLPLSNLFEASTRRKARQFFAAGLAPGARPTPSHRPSYSPPPLLPRTLARRSNSKLKFQMADEEALRTRLVSRCQRDMSRSVGTSPWSSSSSSSGSFRSSLQRAIRGRNAAICCDFSPFLVSSSSSYLQQRSASERIHLQSPYEPPTKKKNLRRRHGGRVVETIRRHRLH